MTAPPILRLLYGEQRVAAARLIHIRRFLAAIYSMLSTSRCFAVAIGQARAQARLDGMTIAALRHLPTDEFNVARRKLAAALSH